MKKEWAYCVKHYSLLMYILLCCNFSNAQYDNISFTNLSSEDGLSQNTIYKIFQDSDGFLWFGTGDGLNKYDGFTFKVFDEDFENTSNLINKGIKFIDEDSKGNFWYGSSSGLNKFSKKNNKISTYMLNAEDSMVNGQYIRAFYIDEKDRVWICTNTELLVLDDDTQNVILKDVKNQLSIKQITEDENGVLWFIKDNGIFQFDEVNKKVELIHEVNYDIKFTEGAIKEDRKGNLWLGTKTGAFVFNINNNTLKKIISSTNEQIETAEIRTISIDKKGNIWLGSIGQGLFKIENNSPDKYAVKQYLKRSFLAPKLNSNHIYNIFIDDSDVLWVGTLYGGINKGDLEINFFHFKTGFKNLSIVDPDPVFSICEDSYQNLWVGTFGSGLYKFDENGNTFRHYSGQGGKGLKGEQVYMITEDENKDIWVCTNIGGLHMYDKANDRFTVFEHPEIEKGALINSVVFKGPKSSIYIGTLNDGVYLYDLNAKKLKHYSKTVSKSPEIVHGWVNYIKEDTINNNLWIAFENGLNIIDLKTDKVYKIDNSVGATNGLVSNYIFCIHQDTEGRFWLGTDGALIEVLNYEFKESGIIELETKKHAKKEGFSNDIIYGILEDDYKNLWTSTNKGLAKFNITTKVVKNYFVSDGLQGDEFNMGAFFKSDSGEFLFGGINGVNAFYPEKIRENKVPPKMVITELRILNNEIKPNSNGVLLRNINDVDELNLNFKDKVFSFEISALEYSNSQKNKYAYKLEGFEDDWNYIDTRRHITFTNLNHGKYTLKLKGTNNDGIWGQKEKSLIINISPPFWRTTVFYIFSGLLFLGIGVLILKLRVKQVKLKSEKQVLYQKNEEKNTMLKEIHHRIKNNLQVVNSLLNLQSREVDDEKVVAMFKDTRKRVLSMAMLHERMYGSDDLQFIDIHQHFKTLMENLVKSYAVDKKIKTDISVKDVEMGISTLTPLGLLLIEIITNSLKYAFLTKSEGTIKVSLKELNDKYELIVGDDGTGFIPKKEEEGLGTKLIQIFSKQLNGTIEKLNSQGTVYRLVFEKID